MPKKLTYTRREVKRLMRRALKEKPGTECYIDAHDDLMKALKTYIKETGKFPPKA